MFARLIMLRNIKFIKYAYIGPSSFIILQPIKISTENHKYHKISKENTIYLSPSLVVPSRRTSGLRAKELGHAANKLSCGPHESAHVQLLIGPLLIPLPLLISSFWTCSATETDYLLVCDPLTDPYHPHRTSSTSSTNNNIIK